jgi:hypothetical protein
LSQRPVGFLRLSHEILNRTDRQPFAKAKALVDLGITISGRLACID